MLKRLAHSRFATRTATFLIGAYIRLVNRTSRRRVVGKSHFDNAVAAGEGVILAFWHGRMLLGVNLMDLAGKPAYMLVSVHRDGEIIANAVRSFGINLIRGSAANPEKPDRNKSGASASAQMIAALKCGDIVGFTPDGPRGPLEKVQPGLIRLAQISGAPIVPAGFSSSRGRRLRTWDRFLLATPFSRLHYVAGPPIRVPPANDAESVEFARANVEKALASVTRQADDLAGRADDSETET